LGQSAGLNNMRAERNEQEVKGNMAKLTAVAKSGSREFIELASIALDQELLW